MSNNLIDKFTKKISSLLNNLEEIKPGIHDLSSAIAKKIEKRNGRVIFVGAGISADMIKIIIDEMWFNFQIDETVFKSITAAKSYSDSLEKWKELEEMPSVSVFELEEIDLNKDDLLIGLSSSGRTQYVISAIEFAKRKGCETALITDMNNASALDDVTYKINTDFGNPTIVGLNAAEGSTVQKILLDNIIYSAMDKAGRIYNETLVYMKPVSQKIEFYCLNSIMKLTNLNYEKSKALLNEFNGNLELALISEIKKISKEEAKDLLFRCKGNFYDILDN